ncbi:MAG: outer membrane beta-barrel protein [Proteobacteria bacterium]|nr:outer membrane beta-barrel protein [Pseudomonadota bacterium]
MRKVLFAAVLLTCGSGAAYAQLPDAYVGAGVSQARLDNIFGSRHDFDLNNTAWKAFVGVRPIPFLGVEANYMDLGSQSRTFGFQGLDYRAHVDAHAFSAFAVGFVPLPVPFLDIFGKAGLARWALDGRDNSSLFALDDHGTDFAWGGGAQAHFGALGLRLEYEQFNVRNTDGAKVVSFDVAWHFL